MFSGCTCFWYKIFKELASRIQVWNVCFDDHITAYQSASSKTLYHNTGSNWSAPLEFISSQYHRIIYMIVLGMRPDLICASMQRTISLEVSNRHCKCSRAVTQNPSLRIIPTAEAYGSVEESYWFGLSSISKYHHLGTHSQIVLKSQKVQGYSMEMGALEEEEPIQVDILKGKNVSWLTTPLLGTA